MSPEDEETVISLLASCAEYLSSPTGDLNTPEDNAAFDITMREFEERIAFYFPELNEEQLDGIHANLFDKVHCLGMTPPDIPAQHMKLVNKGYELYLQRELQVRKSLIDKDYLGQISTGLICYELVNIYQNIFTVF